MRALAARALDLRRPRADLARAEQRDRVPDRRRVRAQAAEQRAEHARARARVRQRAVHRVDLDPERGGQRRQPAAALQRREAAGERDGADHRRGRPLERRARERLAQHAHVEGRVVRHQHPPAQHASRARAAPPRARGAASTIACVIPVKRWMPRPSGCATPTSEVELVVQLAAAHQHRADLGQLAAIAGETVGLGVEREELGRGERLFEHGPRSMSRGSDGATALAARCGALPFARRAPARPARPPDRRPRGLRRLRERENRLRPPSRSR